MAKAKFFSSVQIDDKTTQITGLAGENCYLLEGSERALLIDSLTGVGSLKAFVRELTDLPVSVVLTHGHMDHCGAAYEYGECRMHPDDISCLYQSNNEKSCFDFVSMIAKYTRVELPLKMEDVIPQQNIRTLPVYDKDTFDLGGRLVEVIGVPGHTKGSIVLLDIETRSLFAGDACNSNTLLIGELNSTSVETYHKSLVSLKKRISAFDKLYNGHDKDAVPVSIIEEGIELTKKVLDGIDDSFESSFMNHQCFYGLDSTKRVFHAGKSFNIAYTKDNLLEKQEALGTNIL